MAHKPEHPWSAISAKSEMHANHSLMLVGAAKRLTSGKAVGIDLWQQQDQANNNAAAAYN